MRKLLVLPGLIILHIASAQNVGVGTITPQTKLDVKGGLRTGGLNNYLLYDSLGGKFSWSNSYLWAPAAQYLLMHSASAEGLYYGNSQIEYRNSTGNPVFYTNWSNGNGYFSSRLGIGNANPSMAGLVVDTKVGADHAIFGSNSTGVAIESSWPGIGFNTFYNGNRKSISTGYGGLIYVDPGSGGMSLSVTDASYNTGADVTMNDAMTIRPNGNVGIGTTTPSSKLDVNGQVTIDQKNFGGYAGLLIKGNVPGNNYPNIGFSVTNSLNNDVVAATITGVLVTNSAGSESISLNFGTSQSGISGLADRMVISSNGNVGIGTTTPSYKLDVSQRMRVRSGGNINTSAGIWLNNISNTEAAFIGMADDTHVGFYGNSGAGFKFSMNTTTGALQINGSEGTAGQVLKSNGSSSPVWSNPMNELFNNMNTAIQSGSIDVGTTGFTNLPGLANIPFTITSTSKLVVSLKGNLFSLPCVACNYSAGFIQAYIHPAGDPNNTIDLFGASGCPPNGGIVTVSNGLSFTPALAPGNYYFRIVFSYLGGPVVRVEQTQLSYMVVRQ